MNQYSQSGFLGSRALLVLLFCAAACFIVTGTLLAFFRSEAPANVPQRTLTFAERVAYQRAIEEVYWRHRMWPKERPDAKPSLDTVMPQAELEKKVADYLRKSQALEDYWNRPITAEQLQAEMDRMAKHTKQPEVLRELFEALDHDPFVIAECLARPVWAERLLTSYHANDQEPLDSQRAGAKGQMPNVMVAPGASYMLPAIPDGTNGCTDDAWTPTSITNAPSDRYRQTAVWTGSEMIIWGGFNGSYLNTGGRYNPSTDSWASTSTTNAPAGREFHTAVWTGSEMIVWGGLASGFTYLSTGGRYNPSTDSWTATITTSAPTGRDGHTAIWTGSEMIVWGGYYYDGIDHFLNTGGRYSPTNDNWMASSTTNAPSARDGHTAIWSGSEMILWGGYFFDGSSHWLNTGGRYNPVLDSWTGTSTINAPTARAPHKAVWIGSEMIIWGGFDGLNYLNTGERYNPSGDSWMPMSIINAPAGGGYTTVWTGSEMIVWGEVASNTNDLMSGGTYSAHFTLPTLTSGVSLLSASVADETPGPSPTPTPTATVTATPAPSPGTGGRYAPSTDTWRATTTINAPNARFGHTAVWTGSEMIVWGGGAPFATNTGRKYCAQFAPISPTPTATLTPRFTPAPRARPTPAPRP